MKELLFEKFVKLLKDINEGCALGNDQTALQNILSADLDFVFNMLEELARQEALSAFELSADIKAKIVEIINQKQILVSNNLTDQDIANIVIANNIKLAPEIIANIKELNANRNEALATYKSSIITQASHILNELQNHYDWDRMVLPADYLYDKWSYLLADNNFIPSLIYLSLKVYDDKCLSFKEYIDFFSEHLELASQQHNNDSSSDSNKFWKKLDKDQVKTAEIKLLKLIDYKVNPTSNAEYDPLISPPEDKPKSLLTTAFTPNEFSKKQKRSDKNFDLDGNQNEKKKARPRSKG